MDTAVAEHPVRRRAGKVSGRLVGGVGGGIGVRGGDGVVIPPNNGVIVGNKILLSPSCPMPLCKGSKLAQYSIRETFFIRLVSSCAVLFASKVVEKL